MKKIICLALTVVMVFAMLSITASAADTAKVTYKVNWSTLYYEGYTFEKKDDVETLLDVTKTENMLSFSDSDKNNDKFRAYVALERFAISADTEYEYVFQVKNNYDNGYSGAVFAFADGLPYFIYGGFNNKSNAANPGKSGINMKKATHENSDRCNVAGFTETFITLDLDADGFETFKVVYKGFNVTLYGLVSGSYTQIGNSITLPSNAYVAMGGYNRETKDDGSLERTVSIRNAVIYPMNSAAIQNMSSVLGASVVELILDIEKKENEYKKEDYEEESYTELLNAITSAKALIEGGSYDEVDIEDAMLAIEDAVVMLIPKADSDEGSDDENAGENAGDNAGENNGENAGDNAGENAGDNSGENNGENAGNETEAPAETDPVGTETNAPAGTDQVIAPQGGCGSAILASSALTVVALIGTAAVVSKKKED